MERKAVLVLAASGRHLIWSEKKGRKGSLLFRRNGV